MITFEKPTKGTYGDVLREQIEREEQAMAKSLEGVDPKDIANAADTAKANKSNRAGTIRGAFREAFGLDEQIEAAIARYVTPLKDKRTAVFRGVKKELDIPIGVMKEQYRIYQRGRRAQEMEEGGDKVFDAMKEVHEAIYPGASVDMIAVLNQVEAQEQAAAAD